MLEILTVAFGLKLGTVLVMVLVKVLTGILEVSLFPASVFENFVSENFMSALFVLSHTLARAKE